MNRFTNLRTGYKLAVGFGVTLLVLLCVGAVVLTRIRQMNQISSEIAGHSLPESVKLATISDSIKRFRTVQYRAAVDHDAKAQADSRKDLLTTSDRAAKALTECDTHLAQA